MGQDAPSPYDFYYRTMKNPNIKNYNTYKKIFIKNLQII